MSQSSEGLFKPEVLDHSRLFITIGDPNKELFAISRSLKNELFIEEPEHSIFESLGLGIRDSELADDFRFDFFPKRGRPDVQRGFKI